jgi:hypothetical protein
MNFAELNPFTDWKSVVRLAIGVAVVLLVFRFTGIKKYVS